MEEALFLTRFATKVTVIHRRDEFRASAIMSKRVKEHPKVDIMWNSALVAINGDRTVESVDIADTVTGETRTVATDGVFVAIGHHPNTSLFVDQLPLNEKGYLELPSIATTATPIPGVFASGDVADARYRQAVSAAGTGCMAALDAQHYLASHGE